MNYWEALRIGASKVAIIRVIEYLSSLRGEVSEHRFLSFLFSDWEDVVRVESMRGVLPLGRGDGSFRSKERTRYEKGYKSPSSIRFSPRAIASAFTFLSYCRCKGRFLFETTLRTTPGVANLGAVGRENWKRSHDPLGGQIYPFSSLASLDYRLDSLHPEIERGSRGLSNFHEIHNFCCFSIFISLPSISVFFIRQWEYPEVNDLLFSRLFLRIRIIEIRYRARQYKYLGVTLENR